MTAAVKCRNRNYNFLWSHYQPRWHSTENICWNNG